MRWPYILSLFFLAGATLLLIFNILCGATTHSPIGKWYWLEADTSSIPGAQQTTRWTNYASCGIRGNKNSDCSSRSIAYPMSPVLNFGTTQGVPSGLTKKRGTIYFLVKVGWAFLLVGVIFTVMAFLPVAVSFCVPSLTILNVITSLATNMALFFTALSAALLTAGYIEARNAFRDAGDDTSVGKTMFAFVWTSVFLLLLSSILSGTGCLGNFMKKRKEKKQRDGSGYETDSSSHNTYGNNQVQEKTNENRGGFFSRKKKSNNYDEENVGDSDYPAGKGTYNDRSTYNTRSATRPADNAYEDPNAQYANAGYNANTGSNANTGTAAATAGLAGVTAGAAASSSRKKDQDHIKVDEYPASSGTTRDVTSDNKQNLKSEYSGSGDAYASNNYGYASGTKAKSEPDGNVADSHLYGESVQKDSNPQGGHAYVDANHYTGDQYLADPTASQTLKTTEASGAHERDSQRNYEHDNSNDGSENKGLLATAAAVLGFGAATSGSETKESGTKDTEEQDLNDAEDASAYKSRKDGVKNTEKSYVQKSGEPDYYAKDRNIGNKVFATTADKSVVESQSSTPKNAYPEYFTDNQKSKDYATDSSTERRDIDTQPSTQEYVAPVSYAHGQKTSNYGTESSTKNNNIFNKSSTRETYGDTHPSGQSNFHSGGQLLDNTNRKSEYENKSTVLPVATASNGVSYGDTKAKGQSSKGEHEDIANKSDYESKGGDTEDVDLSTGYQPTEYYTQHVDSQASPRSTKYSSGTTAGEVVAPAAVIVTSAAATSGKSSKPTYKNLSSYETSDPYSYDYKQDYLNSTENYSGTLTHDDYSRPISGVQTHEQSDVSNYHTPAVEKDAYTSLSAGKYSSDTAQDKSTSTYGAKNHSSSTHPSGYQAKENSKLNSSDTSKSSNDYSKSSTADKSKPGILATTLGYMGVTSNDESEGADAAAYDADSDDNYRNKSIKNVSSKSGTSKGSHGKNVSLKKVEGYAISDGHDTTYALKNKKPSEKVKDNYLVDDVHKHQGNYKSTSTNEGLESKAGKTKSSSVSSDSSTTSGKAKAGLLATTLGYIGVTSGKSAEQDSGNSGHALARDTPIYEDPDYASSNVDSGSQQKSKASTGLGSTHSDSDDFDTTYRIKNKSSNKSAKESKLVDDVNLDNQKDSRTKSRLAYGTGTQAEEGYSSSDYDDGYGTADSAGLGEESSAGSKGKAGLLATTLGYIGVTSGTTEPNTTGSTYSSKNTSSSTIEYDDKHGKQNSSENYGVVGSSSPIGKHKSSIVSNTGSQTPDVTKKSHVIGSEKHTDSNIKTRDINETSSSGISPAVIGLAQTNKNPYTGQTAYEPPSRYSGSTDKKNFSDNAGYEAGLAGNELHTVDPYKYSNIAQSEKGKSSSSYGGYGSDVDAKYVEGSSTNDSSSPTLGLKNNNPYRDSGRDASSVLSQTSTKNTNPYRNAEAADKNTDGTIAEKVKDTIASYIPGAQGTSDNSRVANQSALKDSRTSYIQDASERSSSKNQYGAFSLHNKNAPSASSIPGGYEEPASPIASHFEANDQGGNYSIGRSDGVYGDSANPRSATEAMAGESNSNAEKGFVESVIEKAKNII